MSVQIQSNDKGNTCCVTEQGDSAANFKTTGNQ